MMDRLILVLGMHRSGTSMVAGALKCLGVELGPKSQWGGPDNPNFNEDLDILRIDETLLIDRGIAWFAPEVPESSLGDDHMRDIARITLHYRMCQFPLFAIKDPRMCRLLPFWKQVIHSLPYPVEVSTIQVVRHPMAVAKSLKKRNDIPLSVGMRLWVDHVVRARSEVEPDWGSVTVCYDYFLENPIRELNRIARALDLRLDANRIGSLNEIVRPGLRHHDGARVALPADVATEWLTAHEQMV